MVYRKKKAQKKVRIRKMRSPTMGISTKSLYTVNFENPTGLLIYNQTIADTKGYLVFDLNNCVGKDDYISIFDYYRINYVTVEFNPVLTSVVNRPYDETTTGALGGIIPNLITSIDRDSNSSPIGYTEMQLRKNKTVPATKKVSWKFTPNRLTMVYKTVSTTGYMIDKDTKSYLDCGQPDIPHFGLKFCLQTSSPANAFIYEIRIKYNISFSGKRG